MTTSAYGNLTQAEQIFYDLIWQPLIKGGEIWVEGAVPFLDLPIIKQVDESVIQQVTDSLFGLIVRTIDIEAIVLLNSAYQTAYDNASLQLKIIAEEKGTTSSEYQTTLATALAAMSRFTDINTGS